MTLQQVCQAEQQVRARLPGHMRLVLLQVGDAGKVLSGRHLVQELAINFVPGMWAFRSPVDFHAGEDDLGCGGGGASTEIVLNFQQWRHLNCTGHMDSNSVVRTVKLLNKIH